MSRLSRSESVRAAIAAVAVIAAAGCAQGGSLAASHGGINVRLDHAAEVQDSEGPNGQLSASPASGRSALPSNPAAATNPAPPPPAQTAGCVTSSDNGECGPYSDPQIQGTGSGNQDKLQVGNNMWSPIPGATSTLYANSPADWHVIANMPAGNTGVVSYPSVGVDFHLQDSNGNWYQQPLTNFKSMVSSFSEDMHATSGTSAWATYDIWLNGNNEVMIQHDFANNGGCTTAATATFGGSDGVPVQNWHLCQFGSEQVWKLGVDDNSKINEQSGSVDILAMLTWMENHGDLPQGTTIGLLGYGWEIASTGGADEDFDVSSFTLTTS